MRSPRDVPKIHMRIRKSPSYASRRHGVQSYSVCNRMYHLRHYGDPVVGYIEDYLTVLDGSGGDPIGQRRGQRRRRPQPVHCSSKTDP